MGGRRLTGTTIRLLANTPLLAHSIESYAEILRQDGHEVVVLAELRETRGLPQELVEPLLEIVIGVLLSEELYPKIKESLRDWFVRQPKKAFFEFGCTTETGSSWTSSPSGTNSESRLRDER